MLRNIKISVLLICCVAFETFAQETGFENVNLVNLSSFKSQAGNWKIVGGVTMDPLVDVHHPVTPVPANEKKGKNRNNVASSSPNAVTFTEGNGILLNLNDEQKKDNLVSIVDHGDIELEMEVMVPKGSNSGIYLQGRYELQVTDSWGVRSPKFSDMGGIYRNWETDPTKSYAGKAPLNNACKAPGLWQNLKISFRAPRFDNNGKKIVNAKFVLVQLNGITLHENVEVPTVTGGAMTNEAPTGPLMIQGDHGPVAFRNIRYKMMHEVISSISPINYKIYHGAYKTIAEFISLKPVLTGTSDVLTCEVLDVENQYGIIYTGSLTVPEDGQYSVTINTTGTCRLVVNGVRSTQEDRWGRDWVILPLKAGTYPFEIYNLKKDSWTPPRLSMTVKTANSYPQSLHSFNSFPPDENPVSSIFINPIGGEPKLLRAFVDFKGDRSRRLTHTIGVGDPSGVNYIYDLKSGNVVCVWRGDFVDATPMWHDRGDGSFKPRGAAEFLFMNAPLSTLDNSSQAFPNSVPESDFRSKGYKLDEATGRPVFIYEYKGVLVEDNIFPGSENKTLEHKVSVSDGTKLPNLHYKLAEGKNIVKLPNGYYAIDDNRYYIQLHSSQEPIIRNLNGTNELIVPLKENTLHYSITW